MPTTPTSALIERVEAHIRAVHAEIQELLTYACDGGVVPSPYAQKQGDVDVPSCAALRERGLEEYYGNVNMLLVEAWLGKILPALRSAPPAAELLTVRADGVLAGAIFAAQLDGAPSPSALMLGIHRMPAHKLLRHRTGRAPAPPPVTDALVAAVKAWAAAQRLARVYVCPYGGLTARLQALGFAPVADPPDDLRFGALRLRDGVCEDAQLHVLDLGGDGGGGGSGGGDVGGDGGAKLQKTGRLRVKSLHSTWWPWRLADVTKSTSDAQPSTIAIPGRSLCKAA